MSQQILEWSLDGIRIVSADASGRVNQAAFWESFEHHDSSLTSQELGEKLQQWLRREAISAGAVTLLLPREMVVIRQLQLPQAPEEELPDLVRFQAAAKSSMPIDDLALDYHKIEMPHAQSGQSVVTTSIERKRLRRVQEILSAAGFEIQQVTVTPLAVGQFARSFGGATLGKTSPELIVFQRGSLVELSIFEQGALVFSHSVILPEENRLKPLQSGITRSIVALNQSHPNVDIKHCYSIGSTSDQDVSELLQKRFGEHLSLISVPESLGNSNDISGFETLIGAALPVAQPDQRIDLLHPRRKIEKPDRRKWYWIGGGTAALVLLGLAYGSFLSQKGALEASIDALNESISDAEQKLRAGQPQEDAFSRLDTWSLGQVAPLESWNRLRNFIPGTDRLYLSELRLQPLASPDVEARFTGVGFARQRNDVDDLYQNLAENGFRVTPQATTTSSRDPDYPIRFELSVELLREVAQDDKEDSTKAVSRTEDSQSTESQVTLRIEAAHVESI